MLKLGLILALICVSRLQAMELQGMRISGAYIPIEKDEPGNTESPLDNEIVPPSQLTREETPFGGSTVPKDLRDFVTRFMPFISDKNFNPKKLQKTKTGKKKPRKMTQVKSSEPIETFIGESPESRFGSVLDMLAPAFLEAKPEANPTPIPAYPKPTRTRKPQSPFSFGNIVRTVMPFFTNTNPLSQFMSMFGEPTPTPKPTKPTPTTPTEPEYQLPNFFLEGEVPEFVHLASSDHEHDMPSFYSSPFDQQSPLSQFIQIINDPKEERSTGRRNMDADFPLPDFIMDIMRQATPEGNASPWQIQVGEGQGEDAGEMVVNIAPVQRQGVEKTMVFNVPMQMGGRGNDDDMFNIFEFL